MKPKKRIGRFVMATLLLINVATVAWAACQHDSVVSLPPNPCNPSGEGYWDWEQHNYWQGNPSQCTGCLTCFNTDCEDGWVWYGATPYIHGPVLQFIRLSGQSYVLRRSMVE